MNVKAPEFSQVQARELVQSSLEHGREADEVPEGLFTPDNFQALPECRINSGEEVLRKRFETTAVNTLFCSKAQQKQMLEICESCIREETLRGARDSHFFSILTEDVVDTAGAEHAASSLTAVLHALNEVMGNIEVYHEFWFEEATNVATKPDIQVELPGKFRRAHQGNLDSQLTSESYYKEALSVPTAEHIIQELKDVFSEQHLKALKCLSLIPSVMGQLKFNTSEEHHADMYRSNSPNPDTLSAEPHCGRIKWKL
uniref:Uncharacterized protein n=1 Tax=Pipistrellus kuhlii TaxID=59472 RepID=A0A7J7S0L6_PIPKU|nr:hypothetical protein mPipKuh1_010203 [Pipistrellus kuhlii]